MKALEFRPKLLDTLRNYNRKSFMTDLMAGVIVGIVALPLAIAFGIASGVTPEKGIITAIVAGLIISVLGGSPGSYSPGSRCKCPPRPLLRPGSWPPGLVC